MAAAKLSTGRRIAIWACILLAGLLGLITALTVWVQRQALETDNWVETSSRLLEDDEIRMALSVYMVDQLYANVDVAGELQAKLPENTKALAPLLAGGLRQLSTRAADTLLSRPAVQTVWREANRQAQQALVRLIEDKARLIGTEEEDVVLDLRPLVRQLGERLGISERLNQRLGPDAGRIVIMKSDQLETVQTVLRIVKALSVFIAIAMVVLFAIAVFLATGRRRETLRAVGITVAVVGFLLLVVRQLAGNWIVDTLTKTEVSKTPVEHVWDIGTDLLAGIAWTAVIYGLLIVVATWLAGPTRPAVWVRRQLAPTFREHAGLVYAVVGVVYLLVVLWGPTPAFRQIIWILVFGALIGLGTEAFRRLTVREFPAGSTPAR